MEFKVTTPAAADEDLIDTPTVDTDSSFRISARPVVSSAERNLRRRGLAAATLLRNVKHSAFSRAIPTPFRLLGHRLERSFSRFGAEGAQGSPAFVGLRREQNKLRSKSSRWLGVATSPWRRPTPPTAARSVTIIRRRNGIASRHRPWSQRRPDAYAADEEVDFATVPFHLSFQRIVDLLQVTQQENATLTAMLADLSERMNYASLTAEQRELARALETARSGAKASAAARDRTLGCSENWNEF